MKTKQKEYCAIYARTSKDDRNDKKVSTDSQIFDATDDAIKKYGFTKEQIKVYVDIDLTSKLPPQQWLETGKKKYRPDFSRLINDIENRVDNGKITCLISRERDRCSRVLSMSIRFYELLDKYGVAIQCTHEKLPQPKANDPSGRFALNVLMATAQLQLEQTQTRIKANKEYSRKHKLKTNGCCYGYTDNHKKNDINPHTSTIVKKIYTDYLNGISATKISYDLNAKGERGKTGSKFTSHTILNMLRSPNYIGKGICPYDAIIDETTWINVQALLKANKGNTYGIKRQFNLFAGLVKCGYTGESMIYQKRKTNYNDTYRCFHRDHDLQHKDGEATYQVSFEQIEKIIRNHIAVSKQVKKTNTLDVELHLQKATLEKNLSDLKEANTKGKLSVDEYLDMSKGTKSELAKLERQILTTATPIESNKPWKDMTDVEKREHIVNLIHNIQVFNDGIIINTKGGVSLNNADDIVSDSMLTMGGPVWFPVYRYGQRKDFKEYTGFYGYEWINTHGIEALTITDVD